MLVEEVMTREVVTLPPTATIENALKLLSKHRIRHIPIVDDNHHVIGIVSDRDVRDASPSIFENDPDPEEFKKEIQNIMSTPVITVHPLDFIEEVAAIFYENEIACVPVTKENKLVGIVTEKDVLYTLIQLTGVHVQSSQIEIKVKNKVGVLPAVTNIIAKHKINICSVLVYPDPEDDDYKILVFRIQTMNPLPVIQELKDEGYEVLWPNMPGITK
ncbi:acetoin utilization protein AcuB [Melghiribacillus thermohalophilus]|uniref:Acetoin utilization protein AcuB n=1 Tax=Melghiribacillus thermohalophilus TaxID=1324956 RepID=A0A4R3MYR4_9BACI|nr:acetoin utilization AcuB family protein [Melghiribacillus thermohalophilus]TCT19893.1 acetoin utilization protein AcuB [Melghiribacillus thermohalophilus]